MIPPRFLVPVNVKLPDLATAQERSKDGRARKTPTFVYESRQTGIATRKDLFAETMPENSPTRPPRRVGDFVVSAAVQFLFLAVLLLVPLYFSEAIDVHQFNKLLLVVPPRAPAPPPPLTSSQSVAPKRRALSVTGKLVVPRVIPHQVARLTEEPEGNDLAAAIAPGEGVAGGVPGGVPGGVIGGAEKSAPLAVRRLPRLASALSRGPREDWCAQIAS